jgi:hypothetical protein
MIVAASSPALEFRDIPIRRSSGRSRIEKLPSSLLVTHISYSPKISHPNSNSLLPLIGESSRHLTSFHVRRRREANLTDMFPSLPPRLASSFPRVCQSMHSRPLGAIWWPQQPETPSFSPDRLPSRAFVLKCGSLIGRR